MSDDPLKYLRELRALYEERRQGLVREAAQIRSAHPGDISHDWDAKTIEAAASDVGVRSNLLKRIIDKRARLSGVLVKAQKNPELFARSITTSYELVFRNVEINERKRRRKELDKKLESTAKKLLLIIEKIAILEGDSPAREPGGLEQSLKDALKSIDSENNGEELQYSLSDYPESAFGTVMSVYLDIPEQSNHHGNFIRSVDILLRCTYTQEAILKPGIDLSHSELATLAEVCLDLPLGSVNPKSIGQKRAKLKPKNPTEF